MRSFRRLELLVLNVAAPDISKESDKQNQIEYQIKISPQEVKKKSEHEHVQKQKKEVMCATTT